jgi:hypothetical protein
MIEGISVVFLVMGACVIGVQLYRWHAAENTFDLRDLITDQGSQRLSLSRFGQLTALIVSTWALVNETATGRLTEWLFTAYMLSWVGAQLGSLAFKASGRLDPQQPGADKP